MRRDRSRDNEYQEKKKSLYDFDVAPERKGVSGWKLTVGRRNSNADTAGKSVFNSFSRRHKSVLGAGANRTIEPIDQNGIMFDGMFQN